MTSHSSNPHSTSTKTSTSTATTSIHSYFTTAFGLIDEEAEEAVESEVFASTSPDPSGGNLSVVCPLCEAPIDATLVKKVETFPEADPKALPSLFLVYTNKQCDCPNVSLIYREDKAAGPTGTSYGF